MRDLYFFKAKSDGSKGKLVGITDDGTPYSAPGSTKQVFYQLYRYAVDQHGYRGSLGSFGRRFKISRRGKRGSGDFNVISTRTNRVVLIIEED